MVDFLVSALTQGLCNHKQLMRWTVFYVIAKLGCLTEMLLTLREKHDHEFMDFTHVRIDTFPKFDPTYDGINRMHVFAGV